MMPQPKRGSRSFNVGNGLAVHILDRSFVDQGCFRGGLIEILATFSVQRVLGENACPEWPLLSDNIVQDIACDVCQTEVPALEPVCQFKVVQA
mgnify:FL=1